MPITYTGLCSSSKIGATTCYCWIASHSFVFPYFVFPIPCIQTAYSINVNSTSKKLKADTRGEAATENNVTVSRASYVGCPIVFSTIKSLYH
jgi:hypothetical protein